MFGLRLGAAAGSGSDSDRRVVPALCCERDAVKDLTGGRSLLSAADLPPGSIRPQARWSPALGQDAPVVPPPCLASHSPGKLRFSSDRLQTEEDVESLRLVLSGQHFCEQAGPDLRIYCLMSENVCSSGAVVSPFPSV